MKLTQSGFGKVVFARLFEDEDLLEDINLVANRAGINVGFFNLIGTLKKANVGFYCEGRYKTIEVNGPLEIASCIGNVSLKEGKPFAHAHIVVSDRKGKAMGGHVMQGCIIGATAELVLTEAAGVHLHRKFDKKTQLYLWSMEK